MEPVLPIYNWEKPQRQPVAGLVIVFIKTFWEIIKGVWPFLLLTIFNTKPEKPNTFDKWEWIIVLFISLTVVSSILKFLFFRFFIINEELIIQKGWLKKTTVIIPLQKIQTIHIEQTFLHQLLGIVKAGIDTAGSSKTEASIDSLHLSMAKALQVRIHAVDKGQEQSHNQERIALPIFTLTNKDLLRLSLSANHIEAFFILLSFGYSIYDTLQRISERWVSDPSVLLPSSTLFFLCILAVVILSITVLISTSRIFLKFYGYTVWQHETGYYIKGGLSNIKEQLVPFLKIQYITWRANWIRTQLGLWILEYKIAGNDELKAGQKVEVPVTQVRYIDKLVEQYASIPYLEGVLPIRIHRSFVYRRVLLVGILPAILLMALSWYWWQEKSLVFLLLPLLTGIKAALLQKRFRLYAYNDLIFINRSTYGTTYTLVHWYKIQSVTLQQNIYQRKHDLADVRLHTASGNINLPYLQLDVAQSIVNYALYQVESQERAWM